MNKKPFVSRLHKNYLPPIGNLRNAKNAAASVQKAPRALLIPEKRSAFLISKSAISL